MDYRVKSFARGAVNRFAFLIDEHGFTGPEIQDDYRPLHRRAISVTYRRRNTTVATFLVIGYGGDESVTTTLATHQANGPAHLAEDTAHTGYQMRRALDRHSDAIRAALKSRRAPDQKT
jgi:hypothetical protein